MAINRTAGRHPFFNTKTGLATTGIAAILLGAVVVALTVLGTAQLGYWTNHTNTTGIGFDPVEYGYIAGTLMAGLLLLAFNDTGRWRTLTGKVVIVYGFAVLFAAATISCRQDRIPGSPDFRLNYYQLKSSTIN
jgi:sugar phosphate permease